jgi:prepilin-type N-terminal cleavage/methylation domain-containing protein
MSITRFPAASAFSLIEMLVVLAMVALLGAMALPSWRVQQNQAVVDEARLVLRRLDLKQRGHLLRYAYPATAAELPAIDVLSETVAAHYRLEVLIQGGAYQLRLVPTKPDLPALGLSDTGVVVEASAPEPGSAI